MMATVRFQLMAQPHGPSQTWEHDTEIDAWFHAAGAARQAARHPDCVRVERHVWIDCCDQLCEGFACTFRTSTGDAVILMGVAGRP